MVTAVSSPAFLRAWFEQRRTPFTAGVDHSFALRATGGSAPLELRVTPALAPDEWVELFAFAEDGQRTTGLLRIVVGSGGSDSYCIDPRGAAFSWSQTTAFQIAAARPVPFRVCSDPNCITWDYSAMTRDIEALP